MSLGERIRLQRESLDLTRSYLADKAEISRQYLKQIETSRVIPGVASLSRIAVVLGVALSELLNLSQEN
ncbi:MAG: helix-turn-helix domain-containing protein [Dehalobacter sp.]|nr:helix-turn-helix domain-containing protein [Dehalobacter sp.]